MFLVHLDVHKLHSSLPLQEVRLVCSIIDQECSEKGVVINGEMTEDRARECCRIGFSGLNILEGGIHESWSAAVRKKRDRLKTVSQPEVKPKEKDDGKPSPAAADNSATAKQASG